MEFPKRKTTRIPEYDYATPNYYFITICTFEKKCIFGRPGQLNAWGKIAEECVLKMQTLHPGVRVEKWVVMPNHIHAIIALTGVEKGQENVINVVGQFKMAVTKRIRQQNGGAKVWQRSFHDHVIRSQEGFEKIWTYIENNPLKWEEDCFYDRDCGS